MPSTTRPKTAYEIGVRLVGSEMCIRDSGRVVDGIEVVDAIQQGDRITKAAITQ